MTTNIQVVVVTVGRHPCFPRLRTALLTLSSMELPLQLFIRAKLEVE